jgi:hypothetical protein
MKIKTIIVFVVNLIFWGIMTSLTDSNDNGFKPIVISYLSTILFELSYERNNKL